MTPSITACPPTSVSSPLSRTGINCMCAARRKNPVGDTIWILLLLVYDNWWDHRRLPVFENQCFRFLYAFHRVALPFVFDRDRALVVIFLQHGKHARKIIFLGLAVLVEHVDL